MAKKFMVLALMTSLMMLFFGCDKLNDPKPLDDTTTPVNYTLVWSDEFDQASSVPNPDYWGYDLGYGGDGWGNDEWQLYTNNPENVKVEDGNLVISAAWNSQNFPVPGKRDGSITSARLNTKNKFSFKFGKAEARIKAPTGTGMWPAFWMLGNSFDTEGWPQCGEIDIMEISPYREGPNTSLFTMHWWDDTAASHSSDGNKYLMNQPLSDDYHVYAVEWDQRRVVGRIDNIIYFVKVLDPDTMDEFLQKFFLILNVAVGGNFGGAPDETTIWPQHMYVDWVRVYQAAESLIPIQSFGVFTDQTPVDAGLTVGVDAENYVWENTLTSGNIPPHEGSNVISWSTTGVNWFGGGIQANSPIDMAGFAEGNIKFMIKMPAEVTFKIGIIDAQDTQNYVTFPAYQSAYGLTRDGEWGQAVIPVTAIKGDVDLQMLSYAFVILGQDGSQCSFAIDDIYWDGGGATLSSVSFNAASYQETAGSAVISLQDTGVLNSVRNVTVSNGTESISIGINLNYQGLGSGTLNFGATNDESNTIQITAGATLTASYTDTAGIVKTATANITGGPSPNTKGIYSETHTNPMLPYIRIVNSADWSGNPAEPNEQSTAVTPVDGDYALSVNFGYSGQSYGGIAFEFAAQDISDYSTVVLHINKSAMPGLVHLGVKFEDSNQVQKEMDIAAYTPQISGDWYRYEIPLSQFTGVNFTTLQYLGLWNPKTASNAYITGFLYFDNIYLIK